MGRDRIDLGMSAPNVRGRARVQLFGPSGECVRDETKENFVSERWLRAMAWYANWGAFSDNSATSSGATTMNGATAFQNLPFMGIALTDYDGAPDQDERLLRGKPLAHASKGVAGGGAARGAYNADESVHDFAYHKLVYDFATSQANGIFQSIYTGYFNSANNNGTPSRTTHPFGLNRTSWVSGDAIILRDDSGRMYRCQTSQIQIIDSWTPLAYGSTPTVDDTIPVNPAAAYLAAFTIKDSRMYWLTTSVSNERRIVSAPLSDLSNTRVEKTLDYPWAQQHGATATSALNGLEAFTYSPSHDKFFIGNTSGSASAVNFGLMALDPTTFADGDKWGASGKSEYRALSTYPRETGLIANGFSATPRTWHLQLEDDGSITTVHESDCSIVPFGPLDIGATSSGVAAIAESRRYYLAPAQHFFSRALLDEPVEKTPQNTMKITYEFTFDEPVLP